VVGLDASGAMIEIAQETVPDAQFVVGDALELPFPDASFERVLHAARWFVAVVSP
jgi:ubiquinone/menaquinone biosynthesis C-methylase UbiE